MRKGEATTDDYLFCLRQILKFARHRARPQVVGQCILWHVTTLQSGCTVLAAGDAARHTGLCRLFIPVAATGRRMDIQKQAIAPSHGPFLCSARGPRVFHSQAATLMWWRHRRTARSSRGCWSLHSGRQLHHGGVLIRQRGNRALRVVAIGFLRSRCPHRPPMRISAIGLLRSRWPHSPSILLVKSIKR